ncbi:MAG: DUF2851 family protein, partial [Verrucomicrobiota bacterium]
RQTPGPSQEVTEVLGLYGPVAISELLVQKIWLRGDFRRHALRTTDGRSLVVIRPGRWNRLGGPDFIGAEIELEGRRLLGDVEIHFHQRDWQAHGHDLNAAFDGVILHALVFDPAEGERPARTAAGRVLPAVVLAPLLDAGLEEYAMKDALLALEQTDPLELAAPLLEMPLGERRERLVQAARVRWVQKVHFAGKRLAALGWDEACHHACLEVLGYARNRGPMAELAARHPLAEWAAADEVFVEQAYRSQRERWKRQGLRPANQPRRRLQQYAALVRQAPPWPARVAAWLDDWPGGGEGLESTAAFRRRLRLGPLRKALLEGALCGAIASPRADTLVVDALLPLAAARGEAERFWPLWYHWWPGDLPDALKVFLRTAHVLSPGWPFANGPQQAALQIVLER